MRAQVRRRLLRVLVCRGLLPDEDARAMAQWKRGGDVCVHASVRIAAADSPGCGRLLRYCARPPFARSDISYHPDLERTVALCGMPDPRMHRDPDPSSSTMPATTSQPIPVSSRRRSGWILFVLLALIALAALWIWAMMSWSYSSGERAGWVQKFSKKGWICKTWEGELALVTMPGTAQEKFLFTVWDEGVAKQIDVAMGKRVSLHYHEKVGLPGSCFGDTRYWVDGVKAVEDIPLAPGIVVPTSPTPAAPPASGTPPQK